MTEDAKIAKLWSSFHRLSEADKDLVLNFIQHEKERMLNIPVKSHITPDSHTENIPIVT
jgi:hypothetical protein